MWEGSIVAINIGSEPGQPMQAVIEVRAVPGKGLEGDRYFGVVSAQSDSSREVTLIEVETLEALARDEGLVLSLGDSRRNLVTRGVALNHLVGENFQVGEVAFRGVRLCEPCSHLASLTQKEVLPALVHRGGLRARIITEGVVRVGDPVRALNDIPEARQPSSS